VPLVRSLQNIAFGRTGPMRLRAGGLIFGLLLVAAGPVLAAGPKPANEADDFFEKSIRPLLAQNCISCHGPEVQEGGLRLDSREMILHGVEGQPMAVPGKPEHSRIITVTRYDADVQMPPDGKLTEQQLATLNKWVELGLPWPAHEVAHGKPASAATATASSMDARYARDKTGHWAYQPVRHPALPAVHDPDWCATPVDRFILAGLEAKKLKPSPSADRRTLLRRLTFDLTGLPPTPAEMDAFLADKSPDAVVRVVDRLLASPQYGERWARHWLDLARYSDTKGYVFTEDIRYPYAYTYRDYVVRTFNEDLPYDRFILEQLAADQLSLGDDTRPLAAMGFLTVGRRFSNNKNDIIDDRIDVVTRGLQGLTVACARCHDHKYDSIPTDDYYSLFGVLGSSVEPDELPLVGKPEQTPEYKKYLQALAKLEGNITQFRQQAREKIEQRLRTNVGDYLAMDLARRLKDRGIKTPLNYAYKGGGEPRASMTRRWHEYLVRASRQRDPVFTPWHALANLPTDKFAIEAPKLIAGFAKADRKPPINRLVREALVRQPPKTQIELAGLYDRIFAEVETARQAQIAKAAAPPAKGAKSAAHPPAKPKSAQLADPAAEELRRVLDGPGSPAVLATEPELDGQLDQKMSGDLRRLESKVTELKIKSPASPPRAMVLLDAPQPLNPRVLVRGNPGRPGKPVPRQFLRIVAGDTRTPFARGSGRLEMAQAIVSPENPLTARVMVNRIWMHHFGEGLVPTPSDFGVRSEQPSHPELLDWLASTFMEEGWSIKKLHRLIVLSQTYAQTSNDRPECVRVDPDNRLLWRMNRQRLEFEAVRDSLLAVAGNLDRKLGGRPVNLTTEPFSHRRTIYGLVDRQDLADVFRVFDFPSPDTSADSRPQTTVPQQALFVMNSPFVLEQARQLAASVAGDADAAARIRGLYRQALGRSPDSDELALGLSFVASQAAHSPQQQPPQQAIHQSKNKKQPARQPQLSAWEMYAQVLLLANEFMFVD
jgi:mono/diheme cytochrome c family protein